MFRSSRVELTARIFLSYCLLLEESCKFQGTWCLQSVQKYLTPYLFKKTVRFCRETVGFFNFFYTNCCEMHPEYLFIINFIFKLAQAFKSFFKGQISRKPS